MTTLLSVNAAVEQLTTLVGTDVQIRGILSFGFEDVAIYHHPKAERRDDYKSSIWLEVGWGSLIFDETVCRRLDGKLVDVQGTLFGPDPNFGGCGHMSLWPALLLARNLERARDYSCQFRQALKPVFVHSGATAAKLAHADSLSSTIGRVRPTADIPQH